jgi:hypothetical protein
MRHSLLLLLATVATAEYCVPAGYVGAGGVMSGCVEVDEASHAFFVYDNRAAGEDATGVSWRPDPRCHALDLDDFALLKAHFGD